MVARARQSANYADAEDAVQEIFVDISRQRRTLRRTSCHRGDVCGDDRAPPADRPPQKAQRTVETAAMSTDFDPPTAASPGAEAVEFREEAALARKQLESLRPDERKVIELAIDRGLTNSQIADTLKMPLGTVKTNARRGMIRLRELLGLDTRTDVPEGARP